MESTDQQDIADVLMSFPPTLFPISWYFPLSVCVIRHRSVSESTRWRRRRRRRRRHFLFLISKLVSSVRLNSLEIYVCSRLVGCCQSEWWRGEKKKRPSPWQCLNRLFIIIIVGEPAPFGGWIIGSRFSMSSCLSLNIADPQWQPPYARCLTYRILDWFSKTDIFLRYQTVSPLYGKRNLPRFYS